MAVATFSVRMDEKLKKEFDELCTQFGMNISAAINIFARAVVRERRIPFEISAAPSNTGMLAFQSLRQQAKSSGLRGLSRCEINREIAKSRKSRSS